MELPKDFWNFPKALIPDTKMQTLHKETIKKLREENDSADTLELMLIERIATLYFIIRCKEAATVYADKVEEEGNEEKAEQVRKSRGFENERMYRDLQTLWNTMVGDLRKSRSGQIEVERIKGQITEMFAQGIKDALADLPPSTRLVVQNRLADVLTNAVA
jgi:hypothetical protein